MNHAATGIMPVAVGSKERWERHEKGGLDMPIPPSQVSAPWIIIVISTVLFLISVQVINISTVLVNIVHNANTQYFYGSLAMFVRSPTCTVCSQSVCNCKHFPFLTKISSYQMVQGFLSSTRPFLTSFLCLLVDFLVSPRNWRTIVRHKPGNDQCDPCGGTVSSQLRQAKYHF